MPCASLDSSLTAHEGRVTQAEQRTPSHCETAKPAAIGGGHPIELSIRPIAPSDRELLRLGFEALSPESRFFRFHSPLRHLPDSFAERLTTVDGIDHVALIAFESGAPESVDTGICVARFVRDAAQRDQAELAITVVDRAQGCGVSRRLLGPLALAARERGILTFTLEVLKSNDKARRLAMRLGAIAHHSAGGVISYHVAVDSLCPASSRSALR